ncbi:ISXac3 transposase [Xanthomonas axonopodis Xac29-1]|nr:ISXac3 transposase [Xanthomonas axonopodis Xac29-1]
MTGAVFLASHGLVCSMSRRGNCHDNAPVESFFGLLKRERIRRRAYPTKDAARAEVFDYIEMFYNPKRRHGSTGDLSPVEFEFQRHRTVAAQRGHALFFEHAQQPRLQRHHLHPFLDHDSPPLRRIDRGILPLRHRLQEIHEALRCLRRTLWNPGNIFLGFYMHQPRYRY